MAWNRIHHCRVCGKPFVTRDLRRTASCGPVCRPKLKLLWQKDWRARNPALHRAYVKASTERNPQIRINRNRRRMIKRVMLKALEIR